MIETKITPVFTRGEWKKLVLMLEIMQRNNWINPDTTVEELGRKVHNETLFKKGE